MEIKVVKGISLPLYPSKMKCATPTSAVELVAADLSFVNFPLRLLVKVNDSIKKGEAIAQDKNCLNRLFPSPASGKIIDIQRGLKRKLLRIVIAIEKNEKEKNYKPIKWQAASREQLLTRLLEMGAFFRIHSRPFDDLAHPEKAPSHIFVKCLESAPLSLALTKQLEGNEELFSIGIEVLKKLCPSVHLVCEKGAMENYDANIVLMKGKYPKSSLSIAIDKITPITCLTEVIWTLNLYDVICIGSMMQGKLFVKKKIALFKPDSSENLLFNAREGVAVSSLIKKEEEVRVISSHPLLGLDVGFEGYLGFNDFQFTLLANDESRPALHFMRLIHKHFTSFRTYAFRKKYFSTNLNGERRAFIDGSIYQDVMPLDIPVMHLIQALMVKNYEKAIELGLLEVSSEDFALPSFIDPSKIDMVKIVKEGLIECIAEMVE